MIKTPVSLLSWVALFRVRTERHLGRHCRLGSLAIASATGLGTELGSRTAPVVYTRGDRTASLAHSGSQAGEVSVPAHGSPQAGAVTNGHDRTDHPQGSFVVETADRRHSDHLLTVGAMDPPSLETGQLQRSDVTASDDAAPSREPVRTSLAQASGEPATDGPPAGQRVAQASLTGRESCVTKDPVLLSTGGAELPTDGGLASVGKASVRLCHSRREPSTVVELSGAAVDTRIGGHDSSGEIAGSSLTATDARLSRIPAASMVESGSRRRAATFGHATLRLQASDFTVTGLPPSDAACETDGALQSVCGVHRASDNHFVERSVAGVAIVQPARVAALPNRRLAAFSARSADAFVGRQSC
jgi:hypothetical protein